jgi:RNA polymerase sigma-70 factor (ECF subfamily)
MQQKIRGDRDRDGLATLLAEVAAGDKSAFAKLYGLTNRKLFGVALRILRSREAAEDIVQESYVRIWRNAASFDVTLASPIAWMASIVRHCAIDTLRKQRLDTVE